MSEQPEQPIKKINRAKPNAIAKGRDLFIEELKANGGNVSQALKVANLTRTAAYGRFKTDSVFSQAWLDALEVGHDELFTEARRRATEGDPITTYSQNGTKTVEYRKSDTLLIFLMKQGEAQKKWRNRLIQAGNMALETVSTVGKESGLTEDQIIKIQNAMTSRFDQIQLV